MEIAKVLKLSVNEDEEESTALPENIRELEDEELESVVGGRGFDSAAMRTWPVTGDSHTKCCA